MYLRGNHVLYTICCFLIPKCIIKIMKTVIQSGNEDKENGGFRVVLLVF